MMDAPSKAPPFQGGVGEGPAQARSAWRDRYRAAAPSVPPWNAVLDTLLAHRSVRAYRPDPLPSGTLDTLVAAAQSAATSSNLQTWSVVAVTDPARKARLAAFAGNQRHIVECPLFLVFLADLSRAARIGERDGRSLDGLPFLETFLVAAIDAALAAQNASVAAESLGLGTVYIGAMRNRPLDVAAELGLPPGAFATFGLCVGYEDTSRPAAVKPRLPQSAVLHHEQYAPEADAGIPAYDAALQAFQHEQSMPDQPWTTLVANRLATPASLSGRDKLADALRALGFPLR